MTVDGTTSDVAERKPAVNVDPESVYQLVRLDAGNEEGFEQAAGTGVTEAAKTITDLRVARVRKLEAWIDEGAVTEWRVQLDMSFRLDRRRWRAASTQPTVVRRYLLVANQTLGSDVLEREVRTRLDASGAEFHLLVPTVPSCQDVAWLVSAGLDPFLSYGPTSVDDLAPTPEAVQAEARDRLLGEMRRIRAIDPDVVVTGEVGPPNPIDAIEAVLARSDFDEIVLFTLPAGISRWAKMDLPSRVRRRVSLPVTVIEAAPAL